MGTVKEGWYPDPDGKPCERYWDGTKWGEATQPISQPSKRPTKAKKKVSAGKAWAWVIGIGIFFFVAVLLFSSQEASESSSPSQDVSEDDCWGISGAIDTALNRYANLRIPLGENASQLEILVIEKEAQLSAAAVLLKRQFDDERLKGLLLGQEESLLLDYLQNVYDESCKERLEVTVTAENAMTSASDLDKLSMTSEKYVRELVAMNPSTSAETLRRLASDDELSVRVRVAANNNTPLDVLTTFANSDVSNYVIPLLGNPSFSGPMVLDLWQRLATGDETTFLWALPKVETMPLAVARQIFVLAPVANRARMASLCGMPKDLLEAMVNDEALPSSNRGAAKNNLMSGQCDESRTRIQ